MAHSSVRDLLLRPKRPVDRIVEPFLEFSAREASGGILLIIATVVALVWANSPLATSYSHLFEKTYLTLGAGPLKIDKPLLLWINDGLMAIFFLLVGLEIKREILIGELSSRENAMLPLAAAIGGMVVPVGIYVAINWGGEHLSGWGVPMATDIAFAIGILALVGNRIPVALKVFLVAYAIVDDLGAILVVALYYTEQVSLTPLLLGLGGVAVAVVLSRSGVRAIWPYLLIGALVWVAFLKSGVHATIVGVIIAMTIPHRAWMSTSDVDKSSRTILDVLRGAKADSERQGALTALADLGRDSQAPLTRLEHALHPFVTWVVMPIFALANAGVRFVDGGFSSVLDTTGLGIMFGLIVGKPVGIVSFSMLAVKTRLARLPDGVGIRQLIGTGLLGGIGFTMSIFIATLVFSDSAGLGTAKLSILLASLVSGIGGWLLLRGSGGNDTEPQ